MGRALLGAIVGYIAIVAIVIGGLSAAWHNWVSPFVGAAGALLGGRGRE
jgi:hypothetical protein